MERWKYLKKAVAGAFLVALLFGMLFCREGTGADAATVLHMKPGQSKQLKLSGQKSKKASWRTSDRSVARVSAKGVAKAVAPGKAVITASASGKKQKYKVIVEAEGQDMETGTYAILIQAGNQKFDAVLYENETARAFLEKLPLTVTMNELNGNEKYFYFSENLPTAAVKPKNIHTGDLMLYGPDCLVLFYDDFSTSYSYTPIGRIREPEGLKAALGSGNVKVVFLRK